MTEPVYPAPAVIVAHFEAGRVTDWHAVDNPLGDGSVTKRDTVFRIASMSKSFLAATALALRDEGRLDFHRPVVDYVPGIRFVLGEIDYPVTIADLLSNRSGMPEDNAWGDRQLGATREWIEELGREGFKLTSRPGERYQYSNLGMSLVGRSIEQVTGRTVEEEAKQRFLDPLELNHTKYSAEEFSADVSLAQGFRSFDDGNTFVHEAFVASGALACIGSMFSTVDDIARWAGFLSAAFDRGADSDTVEAVMHSRLLSAPSRREMQRIHTPIAIGAQKAPRELDALGYGLGMFSELERGDGAIASHSGGLPGFSSHMRWHTPSGKGVVVFGNSDAFSAVGLAIVEHTDRLRKQTPPNRWEGQWPETIAAAEHIDETLREGRSIAEAEGVVASNFFMDTPAEVRDRRVTELSAELGLIHAPTPLLDRIVAADDASHLRWRIDFERGFLECEIRLIGLRIPAVQSLSITRAVTAPDQSVPDRK